MAKTRRERLSDIELIKHNLLVALMGELCGVYFSSSVQTNREISRVYCIMTGVVLATKQDDVIKWKHFPRYWPFVRGIHRSPVNSPHKGQWRGALMFSLICVWINGWVSSCEAGDLRRYRAHYDVMVMGSMPCKRGGSLTITGRS